MSSGTVIRIAIFRKQVAQILQAPIDTEQRLLVQHPERFKMDMTPPYGGEVTTLLVYQGRF